MKGGIGVSFIGNWVEHTPDNVLVPKGPDDIYIYTYEYIYIYIYTYVHFFIAT